MALAAATRYRYVLFPGQGGPDVEKDALRSAHVAYA